MLLPITLEIETRDFEGLVHLVDHVLDVIAMFELDCHGSWIEMWDWNRLARAVLDLMQPATDDAVGHA
jgi:hypothetical protein